jgi:solute carrier family 50 protein (sugar transporter)
MKVLPLTLIVLHSIDALALPKLRPLRAIKRASLPPPPPPPPPRAAAAALRSALALKGGSLDFSTQVAPVLGATIANAMFASGFPEVLGKRKEGKLGDFNPVPMPIVFGNCLGWLAYSFLTKNPYVAAANVPGLLLGSWYVTTTLRIADRPDARKIENVFMAMMAVHVVAGTTCAFFLPDAKAMAGLYGLVNNAILLLYYGAPLSTIGKVLKDRSAASIYFPTVAVNGLNGCFWSTYALAINDWYLFVPNAIGASLAAIQAVLCVIFGTKKKGE